MKTKIMFFITTVLFCFSARAAEPPKLAAANSKPIKNYVTLAVEKVFALGDTLYVQYRDGRRVSFLRLDQSLFRSEPKSEETRHTLSLTNLDKREYVPAGTGSAAFQASLNPRRRFVQFNWTLSKGTEKKSAYKGDRINIDQLEPGLYTLDVTASSGNRVLAAAGTRFNIADLPELEGVISQGAFSADYSAREVEVRAKLTPQPEFGITYTFQAAGEPPVTGQSLKLRLKPEEDTRVEITASLANGQRLQTSVPVSAGAAPPAALTLSRGTVTYTTGGAMVSISGDIKHARPGAGGYVFGWTVNNTARDDHGAVLELSGVEWGKTHVIGARASSGTAAVEVKEWPLWIAAPDFRVDYKEGELTGEDTRACSFQARTDIGDRENLGYRWFVDGKELQGEKADRLTVELEAGVHQIEADALNKGKLLVKGSLKNLAVSPGPIRIRSFTSDIKGKLGGPDDGDRIQMESIFRGRGAGLLRGPARAGLTTDDAAASIVVDLTRQGKRRAVGTTLDGTMSVKFTETVIKGGVISGAVTSDILVSLSGGFDENAGDEVIEGIIKGKIRVVLSGDRRINGKTVEAEIDPVPVRLILGDKETEISLSFNAGSLELAAEGQGADGDSVTSKEIAVKIVDPPAVEKIGGAGTAGAAAVPGRNFKPAPSAPPARPEKRKFSLDPNFGKVNLFRSRGPHDPQRLVLYYVEGFAIKYADLTFGEIHPLPRHVKAGNRIVGLSDLTF